MRSTPAPANYCGSHDPARHQRWRGANCAGDPAFAASRSERAACSSPRMTAGCWRWTRRRARSLWSTPTLESERRAHSFPVHRESSTNKVAIGFGDAGAVRLAAVRRITTLATGNPAVALVDAGAGGGAVWNAITLRPRQRTGVYVGTGNARGADAAKNRIRLHRGRAQRRYQERRRGTTTPAPGDHQQCDGSTDITLATVNIWRGQPRNVILLRAEGRVSFHVLDRGTGKAILSSKKLGVGAHNHFAQSFSPKTGLIVSAHHRVDLHSNVRTAMRRRTPARARSLPGIPSSSSRFGRSRPPGRVQRRRARDCRRPGHPGAGRRLHHGLFRRRGPPRVGVLYGRGRARRAHQLSPIGKRQYISILNGPTQGAAGKPRRHFGPVRLGFTRASAAPPRPSCSTARVRCRRRLCPDHRRRRSTAPGVERRRSARESRARRCTSKCQWCHGAGAIAGGGAGRICAPRCRPLVAPASFAAHGARRAAKRAACRSSKNSADRELDALRHYIRAQGPTASRDPTAWRRRRRKLQRPLRWHSQRRSPAPKPPPGSLESTGPPPPPQ